MLYKFDTKFRQRHRNPELKIGVRTNMMENSIIRVSELVKSFQFLFIFTFVSNWIIILKAFNNFQIIPEIYLLSCKYPNMYERILKDFNNPAIISEIYLTFCKCLNTYYWGCTCNRAPLSYKGRHVERGNK